MVIEKARCALCGELFEGQRIIVQGIIPTETYELSSPFFCDDCRLKLREVIGKL